MLHVHRDCMCKSMGPICGAVSALSCLVRQPRRAGKLQGDEQPKARNCMHRLTAPLAQPLADPL